MPQHRIAIWVSLLPFLLPSLLWADESSRTTILRVGPGCTYTSIQAAVNAAPQSGAEIRVRAGVFQESVLILDKSVELLGGYQSCFGDTVSGRTTINANDAGPALTFFAQSDSGFSWRRLRVQNFNLTGGHGRMIDGIGPTGGGLNVLAADGRLAEGVLESVVIQNNRSNFFGGGVAVIGYGSGLAHLRVLPDSAISNNTVNRADGRGGGLFCSGGGKVELIGGRVTGNVAGIPGQSAARGGGIAAVGCELDWFSWFGGAGDNWLGENVVHGGGGGMYLGESAEVRLESRPFTTAPVDLPAELSRESARSAAGLAPPLLISLNEARGVGSNGKGGGIWVDSGSGILLFNTRIELNNSLNGNGGGIAATGGGSVTMVGGRPPCHGRAECSSINNNRAGDTGGAVFARGPDSGVGLLRTFLSGNAGEAGAGADVFAAAGSFIAMFDSLLYRGAGANGLFFAPSPPNPYAFWIENNAFVSVARSTLADSNPQIAVFRFGGSDSMLRLQRSIVHEQSGIAIGRSNPGDTPQVGSDCVLWHSAALTTLGSPDFHTRNLVGDPQFIDRAGMNFELQRDSQAVDFCAPPDPSLEPFDVDLLARPRGIQTKESGRYGFWDLGAFEVQPDRLFRDRFQP